MSHTVTLRARGPQLPATTNLSDWRRGHTQASEESTHAGATGYNNSPGHLLARESHPRVTNDPDTHCSVLAELDYRRIRKVDLRYHGMDAEIDNEIHKWTPNEELGSLHISFRSVSPLKVSEVEDRLHTCFLSDQSTTRHCYTRGRRLPTPAIVVT